MQICTSSRTDNHASTPPLSFYRPDALPVAQPTVSPFHNQWYICTDRHWYRLPEFIPSNSNSGLHSYISISILYLACPTIANTSMSWKLGSHTACGHRRQLVDHWIEARYAMAVSSDRHSAAFMEVSCLLILPREQTPYFSKQTPARIVNEMSRFEDTTRHHLRCLYIGPLVAFLCWLPHAAWLQVSVRDSMWCMFTFPQSAGHELRWRQLYDSMLIL